MRRKTISVLVPLIRVPKRLMTGRLSNLLTNLANAAGTVPLVLDLRIVHDRFTSNSDLILNGHLHYPDDIDRSLNETSADKVRKYRTDYNNNPPNATSFMPAIVSTSGRLHSAFV